MSVKERLKTFIKYHGLTVKAFEKSIPLSNGYVNNMFKSIGLEKIELIVEKYSNINLDWLIIGRGEMLKEGNSANVVNGGINGDNGNFFELKFYFS